MNETKCSKCGGTMESGFMLDSKGTMGEDLQQWIDGPVERSVWTGMVKTGNRQVLAVVTMRCDRCGFLESYAR